MRFRRTTLIAVGCASALAGTGLARKFSFEPSVVFFLLFTFCIFLLKPKNPASLITVIILGLSLGLWRGGVYMSKSQVLKSYTAQKVTIQASATSDSIYGKNSQIEFTA